MDGVYVDGNNTPVEGYASTGQLNEVENIPFESNVDSYNEGNANYYTPTAVNGFVFGGWYIDDHCTHPYTFTTMPEGITVYAKWVQVQYRVFLHPNAETDPSLDWGSDTQQMNFRISDGGKVSLPTGLRNDYEFVGWYLDEACTQLFNDEAFVLNDTTVTGNYDKTKDFTDPMDKWGNGATENADVARYWITKKLDLYGKWRAKLDGADGIGVIYDANGGTNAPTDSTLYKDSSDSIAQGASTAPTGKQFLYWVVQTWNGTAYVDTDDYIKVYPGGKFTVYKKDAKIDDLGNNKKSYTIHLKAVYGDKDAPTPTHITWYANNGSGDKKTNEDLQINEAIDIRPSDTFTYTGYDFIGWARLDEREYTGNLYALTENDLWLKYDPAAKKYLIRDNEGKWVALNSQKIAADERLPYHGLYAVWDAYFEVYHSGKDSDEAGVIEKIHFSEMKSDTYDLTQNITENTLYGGYYLTGDFLMPEDGKKYDGSNWTWMAAQTVNGKAITPEAGTRYYIKEVPTTYLHPMTYVIYNAYKTDDTKDDVNHLYLMINTDDQNYKETGCTVMLQEAGITSFTTKTVVTDLTEQFVVNKLHDGSTDTFTAETKYGTTGYIGIAKADDLIKENAKYIQLPYWITPDGIKVTAAQVLQVSIGNGKLVDGTWGKDGGMSARVLNAKSTLTEA